MGKIEAIERLDEEVLGVLRKGLPRIKAPYRLLVMPDHLTPLRIRTHEDGPVPFLLYSDTLERCPSGPDADCPLAPAAYSEREAERSGIFLPDGSKILELLFRKELPFPHRHVGKSTAGKGK